LCLPVIDMTPWLPAEEGSQKDKKTERGAVVEAVRTACEETGFLAITNIPKALQQAINRASTASKRFFMYVQARKAQADEIKSKHEIEARLMASDVKKLPVDGLPKAYGYFPMKSEALGYQADVAKKPDLREAFSMGPVSAAKRFRPYLAKGSRESPMYSDFFTDVVRFLFQPTPWPTGLGKEEKRIFREFKESLTEFYEQSSCLGRCLLRVIATALKLSEDHFEKAASDGEHCNSARAIFYPKLTSHTAPGQARCGAHSDTGAITLLWSDTEGLELQPKTAGGGVEGIQDDKAWFPVSQLVGKHDTANVFGDTKTMLVNIGDLLEFMSKGSWKSTPHRVSAPRLEADENKDRLALVNFIILAPDFKVGPDGKLTQGEHAFSHFMRKGRNAVNKEKE